MRRSFKIIGILLAVLVLTPVALMAWLLWGQFYYYSLSFGPQQAQHILARFGLNEIKVKQVLQHSGHPPVWMDGAEKFVVELETPFVPPHNNFMAEEREKDWNTQGRWLPIESEWPWAIKGTQLAIACAHSPVMGTDVVPVTNYMRSWYSFMRVPKAGNSANIEALIYDTASQQLTYVYCNY